MIVTLVENLVARLQICHFRRLRQNAPFQRLCWQGTGIRRTPCTILVTPTTVPVES